MYAGVILTLFCVWIFVLVYVQLCVWMCMRAHESLLIGIHRPSLALLRRVCSESRSWTPLRLNGVRPQASVWLLERLDSFSLPLLFISSGTLSQHLDHIFTFFLPLQQWIIICQWLHLCEHIYLLRDWNLSLMFLDDTDSATKGYKASSCISYK